MQESPLISVMIITYNHEKYVRQAVEGALMQKCTYPFEIVLCDDFSTDNTRQICKQLQNENPEKIRLIFNEKNKGVIENYIGTMRQCRGKYIADCAGDDYWIDPYKLQKQADILESRKDIILVYTNWKDLITETGEIIGDSKSAKNNFKKELLTPKDLSVFLNQKGSSIVNINTSCFRRAETIELIDKHPYLFDKSLYACEDFQLLFLLLSRGNFYYIDDETGVYRNNKNSVSTSENYSKLFIYQFKETLLKIKLSKDFGIDINTYLERQWKLLIVLAIKAKNRMFAKKTRVLLLSSGYRWNLKTEFLYRVSNNNFLLYPFYTLFLIRKSAKRIISKLT